MLSSQLTRHFPGSESRTQRHPVSYLPYLLWASERHQNGNRVEADRNNQKVQFYEFLGMSVVKKLEYPDNKFDLYFLGYNSPKAVSHGNSQVNREGVIELTHNYGTENDASFTVNTGNKEPHRGFGHTCISVDNIQAACQRLQDAGYKFQKKLTDGRMNNIAFVLDPDGYWVEIIGQNPVEETAKVKETDVTTYRMVSPGPQRNNLESQCLVLAYLVRLP